MKFQIEGGRVYGSEDRGETDWTVSTFADHPKKSEMGGFVCTLCGELLLPDDQILVNTHNVEDVVTTACLLKLLECLELLDPTKSEADFMALRRELAALYKGRLTDAPDKEG